MDGFEKIWEEFSYVIEEMRDGMGFIEGFILDVAEERLDAAIHTLCSAPMNAQLSATWSNEPRKADWDKKYSPAEYLRLFQAGKIVTLKPQLNTVRDGIPLEMMLMIEKWDDQIIIEIICYRETILSNTNPKIAVRAAVLEFAELRRQFGGSALFIGPDNLDYPKDADTYPPHWIKIADGSV